MSTTEWWSDFFDDHCLRPWRPTLSDAQSDALLSRCGFQVLAANAGLSTAPFTSSVPSPRRVAILCERV